MASLSAPQICSRSALEFTAFVYCATATNIACFAASLAAGSSVEEHPIKKAVIATNATNLVGLGKRLTASSLIG